MKNYLLIAISTLILSTTIPKKAQAGIIVGTGGSAAVGILVGGIGVGSIALDVALGDMAAGFLGLFGVETDGKYRPSALGMIGIGLIVLDEEASAQDIASALGSELQFIESQGLLEELAELAQENMQQVHQNVLYSSVNADQVDSVLAQYSFNAHEEELIKEALR